MLEWWKAGTPIAHSSKLIAQSQAKGGGGLSLKNSEFSCSTVRDIAVSCKWNLV